MVELFVSFFEAEQMQELHQLLEFQYRARLSEMRHRYEKTRHNSS